MKKKKEKKKKKYGEFNYLRDAERFCASWRRSKIKKR